MKKIINYSAYLVVIISLTISDISSQPIKNDTIIKSELKFDKNYIKNGFKDAKTIITEPLRWNSKHWLLTGLALGTTASIYYTADAKIQKWSQREENHTKLYDDISFFAEKAGNGTTYAIGLPVIYIYGAIANNQKAKRVALLAAESFVMYGLIVQIPKYLTGRMRPKSGETFDTWTGPHWFGSGTSFFSGHTGTAFAMATIFALEFKDYNFVAPIAYTLAAAAGYSRVHDNKHWMSDVFLGAVVGHCLSRVIVREHPAEFTKNLSLSPVLFNKQNIGFSINYKF